MQNTYHTIGLMSGTSCDGLDIIYCRFEKNETWTFQILEVETIEYNSKWQYRLLNAHLLNKQELGDLSFELANFWSTGTRDFIAQNNITQVDLIASHGHTIFHEPNKGITFQIGSGKKLFENLSKTVVYDFRTQDVKLGGQGAPLVPVGDKLLFSDYSHCLNLGGIANVSFEENGKRIAFDICHVNMGLNHLTKELGFNYDDEGRFAKSGSFDQVLYDELNSLEYYQKPFPKSLGKEDYENSVLPVIKKSVVSTYDKLHTLNHHVAKQIAKYLPQDSQLLVTGGGAYNKFLMSLLRENTGLDFKLPDNSLIDFKEALIFAFLGVLRIRGENNCLSSVTGASRDHSSGIILE